MFEKEARKYAEENKKIYGSDEYADITDYNNVKKAFQKGAEFGYNKTEQENAELKKQVEQKQHLADVRLEQSLENYKLFSDERKTRIDVDIALEDTTDKLTKLKGIVKRFLEFVNNEVEYDHENPEVHTKMWNELCEEAEQFLKDSEVKE